MRYQILDTTYNPYKKNLRINFSPSNDVLNSFFASIDIECLGKFLQNIILSKSYYQSPMSLRFYKDLDWEDIQDLSETGGIKEDEVIIYHEVYGETIVKESFLTQIILDYSRELIGMYKDELTLPPTWTTEMNEGINQLENKIKGQT